MTVNAPANETARATVTGKCSETRSLAPIIKKENRPSIYRQKAE
jgi:hypothetical protein